MFASIVHVIYLLISVVLTVWVAQTLSVHGRTFLVVHLGGDEALAESLNRLLVVGFYLINLGYASLALSLGRAPENLQQAIEQLSLKIGAVMLILGLMHLFNMLLISRLRSRAAPFAPAAREPSVQTPGAP